MQNSMSHNSLQDTQAAIQACRTCRTRKTCRTCSPPLQDMQAAIARAVALIGLQSVEPHDAKDRMTFRIQKSPVQRVFALQSVPKDGMIIAPLTTNIDSKPQNRSGAIEVCVGKTLAFAMPSLTKSCLGEFWAIRRCSDKAEANCELTTRKVVVQTTRKNVVSIPCIRNSKAISEGDEVVLHVPEKASRKASESQSRVAMQVEAPLHIAKKAKV